MCKTFFLPFYYTPSAGFVKKGKKFFRKSLDKSVYMV